MINENTNFIPGRLYRRETPEGTFEFIRVDEVVPVDLSVGPADGRCRGGGFAYIITHLEPMPYGLSTTDKVETVNLYRDLWDEIYLR